MRRTRALRAAAGPATWLALAAACTGQLVGGGSGPDAGPVDAGPGVEVEASDAAVADAGDPADPRLRFASTVEPILSRARPKGTCVDCHEGTDPGDGPDFLGPDLGSHYESLTSDPRLIGDTPDASLLFTRGDHAGDAFCTGEEEPYPGCAEDESAAVADWIASESARGAPAVTSRSR